MLDDSGPSDRPSPHDVPTDAEWDALARYVSGESPEPESAAVTAWLDRHPAEAAMVAWARGFEGDSHATSVDVERALAQVRVRIDAEFAAAALSGVRQVSAGRAPLSLSSGARAATRRAWHGSRVAGFAAAATLVIAVGFSARRVLDGTRSTVDAVAPATGLARVFETRVGVRDSVILPDGSRVMLAPGSRLSVAADFDAKRTVELEGAAYFEVKHDAARSFTVRSRDAEIRDIGTAFSVSTDASGSVTVAVTEGVVAMRAVSSGAGTPVELRAGDRGVMGAWSETTTGDARSKDEVVVSRGAVTADDVAWTHGDLIYRDAPMSVVQADLKRWYGIELQLTDSTLRRRTLKVSFAGDSAASAVRKIALALGAEAVQRGDTILLRVPARGDIP